MKTVIKNALDLVFLLIIKAVQFLVLHPSVIQKHTIITKVTPVLYHVVANELTLYLVVLHYTIFIIQS